MQLSPAIHMEKALLFSLCMHFSLFTVTVHCHCRHGAQVCEGCHSQFASQFLVAQVGVLGRAMVKSVRVGTDFSGLETPCRALCSVGVPHKLVFASEKHKRLAKLIQFDFKPEHFYKDWFHPVLRYESSVSFSMFNRFCLNKFDIGLALWQDVLKRSNKGCAQVDLYVAGPPCQPFSTAGKHKGWSDFRAKIMRKSGEYIHLKQPRAFVLENVPAWRKQRRYRPGYLKFKGALVKSGYSIFTKDLKTSDHGLPQARVRTYMVGFKTNLNVKNFDFPEPLPWGALHPTHFLLDDVTVEEQNQCRSETFTRNLRTWPWIVHFILH